MRSLLGSGVRDGSSRVPIGARLCERVVQGYLVPVIVYVTVQGER
jgi:hypothetical protein